MSSALNLILEEIKQEVGSIISKVNKKCLSKSDELNVIYDVYNGLKEIDIQLKEIKKSISYIENVEDSIKVVLRTKSLSSMNVNDEDSNDEMNIEKIKVFGGHVVNAISVNKVDFLTPIINCPFYFCKKSNKFYLKINGKLLNGGLCNFYSKRDKNAIGILRCKWGEVDTCKENRKYIKCKYYHDDDIRNYTWTFLKKALMSKNSLNIDTLLSNDEKKMLGSLVVHCLLLLQI